MKRARKLPSLPGRWPEQRRTRDPLPTHLVPVKPRGKTMTDLDTMLASHFRNERAIAAAKRYLSRELGSQRTVSARDVVVFLRRRRDPIPDDQIDDLARRALHDWVNSRANRRYRESNGTPASVAGGVA